jgi:hypothetical protein
MLVFIILIGGGFQTVVGFDGLFFLDRIAGFFRMGRIDEAVGF